MAVENLVIKFDVDTKELDFGIKALETLGKVDKATADQFRAANAAFQNQKQAIAEVAKETKVASNEVKALSDASKAAVASTTANTEATKKSTNAFQSLRQEIRSLKAQILDAENAGDNGLVEKLRKQAALATDRMGDLNKSIKNLSSDTRGFDAVLGAAKGVAAGFAVAQGSSALFGSQNKDLEKTLIKLQGALALLNGLTEIQNVLQADSAVGVAAASAKRVLLTGVTVGMTTAEIGATVATNLLNVAVKGLLSPLGLILTAVGLAGAAYAFLSGKTKDATEAAIENRKEIERSGDANLARRKILADSANAAIDLAKANGASERTILEAKKKVIASEILSLQGKDKSGETLSQKEKDRQVALLKEQTQLSLESIALYKNEAKEKEKIQKDSNKKAKGSNVDEEIEARKAKAFKLATELTAIEKKETDSLLNEEKARQAAFDKLFDENEAKKTKKELEAIAKKKELKDLSIQGGQDISNAAFEIDKANRDFALSEDLRVIDEKRNAQFADIDLQTKKQLENKNLTEKQRQDIEEKAAKKKKVIEDKLKKEESAIKKKAFEDDKKAAILQAIINTALAITKALPIIPLAIAAGIAGAAQIAVIASQPTPKFAKGTQSSPEGMAIVGEQGRELIVDPSGKMSMSPDKASLTYLKRGSKVFTAFETERLNLLNNMTSMSNMYIDPSGNVKERLEIDEYAMARAMSKSVSGSSINIANHEALAKSIASEMNTNKNFF